MMNKDSEVDDPEVVKNIDAEALNSSVEIDAEAPNSFAEVAAIVVVEVEGVEGVTLSFRGHSSTQMQHSSYLRVAAGVAEGVEMLQAFVLLQHYQQAGLFPCFGHSGRS